MTERESLDLIETYAQTTRNKLISHLTYYQIKAPRLISKINELITMIELLDQTNGESNES